MYLHSKCKLAVLFEEYEFKLFSQMPLRSPFIQGHVAIDKRILCRNILKVREPTAFTKDEKTRIRSQIVNLQSRVFKSRRGCEFGGTIYTDCVSISIIIEQAGTIKRKRPVKQAWTNENRKQLYFENNVETIRGRHMFAVDPNKRDLLFFPDENRIKMRYTAMQRRV